ncbi:hypothetical protein PILCRDRAFT_783847 [Piloderma croceum F 1598]|uniref:Zn(2)-C6 fungal-type domain-containing protein n=1 Tax=Piloderma croceum (strain F 1598) TaxID=765440 RepID=A0A0C3FEN1_PILCF|nr:hypothetical protein PILCRDRAFT_783847 [Piloderma croceum F 1598]
MYIRNCRNILSCNCTQSLGLPMPPVTNYDFSFGEMTPVIGKKKHNQKVSCNECRRLKLRCNRVFPCSNCVKKGCGVICPDGSLITGRGNRFVLANEEQLYARIGTLSERVRKLENALTDTHSSLSKEPHPLLTDKLLLIKEPLERNRPNPDPSKNDSKEEEDDETDEDDVVVVASSGRTTFFGRTASSWQTTTDDKDEAPSDWLAPHVRSLNFLSPFREGQTPAEIHRTIINQLPEVGVARHLSQIYFRHAAWQYNPISEAELEKTIIGQIYATNPPATDDKLHPHYLAILFSILAIGTLLDLDRPPFSPEAAHYYQLGRAALSLKSVLEEQSITAIRALLLMFHYMLVGNVESSRWVTMGLIAKLAHSVTYADRDSNKWKVSPEETIRRQALWWEVYSFDLWQSFTYGRPPSFMAVHVDCKMAYETTLDGNGMVEMSYAAWKHRFSLQCLSIIHDRAFGARTPSYKTIQELARGVRDFYVPPSLRIPGFSGATVGVQTEQPTVQITMQRCIAFSIKELVIMYMHRGFFARTIEDNVDDPLGSPYGPSVLAVYGISCSLVGMVESLFLQHPNLMERMWFLYIHIYSCALVLGAIATKPRLAFAPSALSHLECALRLFEKMSGNPRTEKILVRSFVVFKPKGSINRSISPH